MVRNGGMPTLRATSLTATLLLAAACGGTESDSTAYDPYAGEPPLGDAIRADEGEAILDGSSAPTGWRWVEIEGSLCNDARVVNGSYVFSTSQTGIAINRSPTASNDLVVFLQGGGACWDFVTCGGLVSLGFPLTASTGPFGAEQFRTAVCERFPNAWLDRANLPPSLAGANLVFVPYCTGDVHGGDRATTYAPPPGFSELPAVTWQHRGHANLMAILARLGATFPSVSKLVVAGSSAGGFGVLANYPAFRWYWPDARGFLIDDSAPPLIGSAIPSATRAGWYASWNLGVSLDAFCTGCRMDMSRGLTELAARFPDDRIALVSHLEDDVIRSFYGTYTISPPAFTPMPIATFEAELRLLGSSVIAPAPNARYFFTDSPAPGDHPTLDDPTVVTTPAPGLPAWLSAMVSDDPVEAALWTSVADAEPAP